MSFCISLLRNPDASHEEKKWAVAQMFPYSHPQLNSVEARTGGKTHENRLEVRRLLDEDEDDVIQLLRGRRLSIREQAG